MTAAILRVVMERDAGGHRLDVAPRRCAAPSPQPLGAPILILPEVLPSTITFGKGCEQMSHDMNPAIRVLLGAMTSAERHDGVAYLRVDLLSAGETFPASPNPIVAARASYLAFVDPSPAANWGHDCRYLTIDAATLAVASHAARFPPFGTRGERRWEPVYRAPGVPDAFVWRAQD
jgi:hypothetical protein